MCDKAALKHIDDPNKCHIVLVLIFCSENENVDAKMIFPTNHESYFHICESNCDVIFLS